MRWPNCVMSRPGATVVAIHLLGAVAGYLLSLLHVPLPWMIGPMLLTAVLGLLGMATTVPNFTRPAGQMVVAAVVGLSFTPASVVAVGDHLVLMLVVSVCSILAGLAAAGVLARLTRMDWISAALATVPGGPAEMSALALRHGVPTGPVVLVQTMRIALLVLVIPPLLVALNGAPFGQAATLIPGDHIGGGILLLAIAAVGSLLFHRLRFTSPFFLGALALSASASALSLPVSMPPAWVLAAAQVLLGVWLGCMFDRALMVRASGFIPAALASTAVLLVLSSILAVIVAASTGIGWQTMVLSTAPGSVTEMALTARLLHQDVAMVAAFHVVRIFIIFPLAPLLFSLAARMRSGGGPT